MHLFSYGFFFFGNWKIKIPKPFVKVIMKPEKKWKKEGLMACCFEDLKHRVQISIFFYWSDRGQVAVLPSLILKEISQHQNAAKINVLLSMRNSWSAVAGFPK